MNKNDMKEKSETCWTENYYAPMQPAIAFWVIISLSIIWRLGTSWVLIARSIILIMIARMQNTSISITTIRQQLLLKPAARMFVSQLLS